MHNMVKKSLCLALLISCSTGLAVAPYYSIRSQSENVARELVGAGWNTQINLCDMDKWYGNFSITPEYTRSFRPCHIAQCLFGCNSCCNTSCGTSCGTCCGTSCGTCCGTSCGTGCGTSCCDDDCYRIKISGSKVASRGSCDWLADHFGLPTDYQGSVTFKPQIDNFLVDFNFYLGLDEWCKGMYFKIHAPVVHTRWDLNMCECAETSTADHQPGYFNGVVNGTTATTIYGISHANLVQSFTSFITGCGYINAGTDTTFVFNKLTRAKMSCGRCTDTALADIQMALGWNFWCDEDYHAGLNIRAVAPTGTRPEGCYLFEPIVGNGKHFELGGGFTGHWVAWRSEDEERSCAFFLDANVTHLFKAKQCRTFDLCCKPLSRYMLAAKFKTNTTLTSGAAYENTPVKQFEGTYCPLANLTTMPVDVSVGVQGDLALMFQYLHNSWSFDLGYNFWGRSCEKIEFRCDCPCPFTENTWVLKGDAFMYGFPYVDAAIVTTGVALSSSQSCATIYKGTNQGVTNGNRNYGINNPELAWRSSDNAPLHVYTNLPNDLTTAQVYTSHDPVFIKSCDIDLSGARTKGISHKLFAHFDYTWRDREDWIPYLGVGGEVELAQKPCDDCCNNNCNPCYSSCGTTCGTTCGTSCCSSCGCNPCCCGSCCTCALSQWGVWLKGGVAFD